MTTSIHPTEAIAAANAVVDGVDAGPAAGVLKIYTGAKPASVDLAATGTLLAELTMSDPAFGNAVDAAPGGRATANAISDDTAANANGDAGWFRVEDSNGKGVFDGDVTATGGGGALELNTITLSTGINVAVSSLTYTQPES